MKQIRLPSYLLFLLCLTHPLCEMIHMVGIDFVQQISSAYDVSVHWCCNLFLVPFGKAGKVFVGELAKLFTAYGEDGALECIALKAAMVLCSLLLQRPFRAAKIQVLIACLDARTN